MDSKGAILVVTAFLNMFMSATLSKRLVCIVLLAARIKHDEVATILGICSKTVKMIQIKLDLKETSDLLKISGGGRKRKTANVEEEIVNEICDNQYHSRQQIADKISEKWGISLSISSVGELLKRNGIKLLKCGSLPAKADPSAQRKFFEKTLQPLMERARNKEVSLLFVDASHFVMGCDFLGRVYGKVRHYVRTCSGRKRYNVLGALNFVTKSLLTVTNDTYITATQVCEMLLKISREYQGKAIYMVLDNASYQKCRIVTDLAKKLGIHLIYIPPYSPNLNLIERLWKFVKAELRKKYYSDFRIFVNKIDSITESTAKEHKAAVDRLISEKVQLFDELVPKQDNPHVCSVGRCQMPLVA